MKRRISRKRGQFVLPSGGRLQFVFATLLPGENEAPGAFLERYGQVDGALRAYRVGTLKDTDGNFSFAPLPAYQGKDLSEKNLTPELAKELAGMVKASSAIKPASFKSGVVAFDNLELGLYLIVQTKSISGYEKVAPFLVSVPLWDKDHYLYEINVSEKFEIKKEPPTPGTPETPDQPGDKLPQTGQVNWPMPVLLILGLALIVTGTALKRKSKHAR